jgi:type 1 fimbria pilin
MSQSTAMKLLILIMLAITVLTAAPGKQTFTGTITDSMCSTADHSQMKMGPTDAECTKACVGIHGATYVLYDGKNVYELSDQKTPEKFAAKKVTVTGTLDAKSKKILVDSITAAK